MNPRILIFIDTYAIGGAGKVVVQFLRYGGRDVCIPIVAGFWRGPAAPWQFRDAVVKLNVRFEVLKQKFAYDPLVINDALKLVRKDKIQILESHGYKGHVVCLALQKLTGLPWVAYIHGWTHENGKVALYNQIDRNIVRFADRVIPVSKDLGSKLRLGKRTGEKMVVVNNAADIAEAGEDTVDVRSGLNVNSNEVLIGVIGRLSPEKGHRYLLEAMKLMPAGISLKAVFIGDGQEKDKLSKAIEEGGLAARVMLAGFKADVAPFYKACDIVVLPSLAEGMPNAALEAMAFGRPVVASNVGGIPEVVVNEETGLLVPPGNPEALATALVRLAGDRSLMKTFGMAGRKRAECDFSPTKRVARIADIYRKVLHA